MQNRRQIQSDPKNQFEEALNETDSLSDQGIRVNAEYFMQIFNLDKGHSK